MIPDLFLSIFVFSYTNTILQQIKVKINHLKPADGIQTHDLSNMSLLQYPVDQDYFTISTSRGVY